MSKQDNDFEYELNTTPDATTLRRLIRELILTRAHSRLVELPTLFSKYAGDEARLLAQLKALYGDDA